MVNTRSTSSQTIPPTPIPTHRYPQINLRLILLSIPPLTSCPLLPPVDTIDVLAAEVAALKAQLNKVPQANTNLDVTDKGKTKVINHGSRDKGRTSWSEDEEDVEILR